MSKYFGTDGERPDRRRWRMQGGERVAAVCVQRRRAVGKAHTGYRNRIYNAECEVFL